MTRATRFSRLSLCCSLLLATVAHAQVGAPWRAAVSSAHPLATEAGLQVLREGGSAADAAAAVMLALTVVEPQSSGIGGGGFLLHHGADGRLHALDGRETAPAAAQPTQFLDAQGRALPFAQAATGGASVGVPGNIALMALAHRRYGRLPWARLFAPAIALAEGFEVSPQLSRMIGSSADALQHSAEARALYLRSDGQPLRAGTRLSNPALADSLRALAAWGPGVFYTGHLGAQLRQAVAGAARQPAVISAEDLAGYQAREREPVCGAYRQWRVCGMGPPSSGGIAVLQILQQLEGFDLRALGPRSAQAWHLLAESQRLAYADREQWVGDPDFVAVPTAGLTARDYSAARGALIRAEARLPQARPGQPAQAPLRSAAADTERGGTSHFVVADAQGNVLSWTSTVERVFGSGLVAGGFVLNNELTDFNFEPGPKVAPSANALQPGKRPRSSMAPTVVYDAQGRVLLSLGAAGGPTIIAQVAKALVGVLDWGLPLHEALALPQLVAMGERLWLENAAEAQALAPGLRALGHQPQTVPLPLKLNGLQRVGEAWQGAADPRGEGSAAGL